MTSLIRRCCSCLIFLYLSINHTISYQYGCNEVELCTFPSELEAGDEIYCTAAVSECNILCTLPNSCQSITIYSAAESTLISCDGSSSCLNATIFIGDTGVYPSSLAPSRFINPDPITSQIQCNGEQSCSSLNAYFNGNTNDECNISSTNTNAFKNGYFDCMTNGDLSNRCHLLCDDTDNSQSECLDAFLDCNSAENTNCKCLGGGCSDAQNVIVYYENDDENDMENMTEYDPVDMNINDPNAPNTDSPSTTVAALGS